MKLFPKRAGLRRVGATLLALVMVIGCMSVPVLAADEAEENVHVLEASALTAFAAGAKADGDTESVGDYFTIIYSAKSKVDSSNKDWDDGYSSGQRINFGGKATTEKNAVKFTTANPATVKIWWAQGGDDNREIAVLNTAGEIVAQTSGTYEKNKAYMSTLELTEGGTYFLGGATNNNYIFKIEVEENAASEKVSVLEASALTAFAAGAKADGDTESVGDYFTIIYSAKSKVDSSNKDWPDGYTSGQRINFGGKATTEKNAVKFTTSGPAVVKIWWAQGGDDNREYAILNSAGEVVVKTSGTYEKNQPYLSTLELAEAGTYFLGGETNNNYLFKVEVTETVGTKAPRADWAGVAAPEIKSVETAVDETTGLASNVKVTVTGEVGYDAADEVRVIMRDADGWEVSTKSSLAEKSEHELTFSPAETGTYTFEAVALREDEDAHRGEKSVEFAFTYPLGVPVMKYAVNDGKGGLTVEWNPVKEATGYTVTAGDKTVTTEGLNATKATVEGLTVGDEVEVTVTALRGDEKGKASEAMKTTVSAEAEVAWVFSAFGQSIDKDHNGAEPQEDGSVRVYSTDGKGKVQSIAQDGLAFYYTAIDPSTTNFKLTATAHVNTWHYSNGQDGFGLIVMDKVGINGDTAPVWSNSLMAGVTGFSDTYNGERVQMRLGVGTLERSGVTEDTTSAAPPAGYTATWRTLDITGFGSDIRNLVGNADNEADIPGKTLGLVDFTLTIEKDDEGYHVSYLDHNGVLRTNDYPDPGMLSYVDPYVYVGMFAARNCDITFTDIELTTSEASGSTGGTVAETKKVDPSYKFDDSGVSNTADYTLGFTSNADGTLVVKSAYGNEVYNGRVEAGVRTNIPVTLRKGGNSYTATITPDEGFAPAEDTVLSSYAKVTVEHTVTYKVDEREVIYVSPNGTDDGAGTQEDPTTLAEAVKCPAPGATIILMEGTYNYGTGVTIARGINGTEEEPITLMADPNAGTRPVLDWGRKGNGLVVSGNYWHIIGFDSTNSTAKGVHVGGKNNVVERVNVYRNMNTGLSVTRTWNSDVYADWPSDNLILNCSAWLNADSGYEDADGFEAKLTNGDGNVFDGCIAAYNADDGWDLYARGAANGAVTVRNSIAFKNGWDIVDGKEVDAGNGNGFKLGGNSYAIDHRIENSIAFANKRNGFTCNSNPNLAVENCTGFANGKGNLALYTEASDSAYTVDGYISFQGDSNDSIAPEGTQDTAAYLKDTNYFTGHTSGEAVDESWFKSVDIDEAITVGITRNADGTISMAGFLELTDAAPADAGARLPGEQEQNFRDVNYGSWYGEAVELLRTEGIMNGMGKGTFAPGTVTSRAMVATILNRVADNAKAEEAQGLTDVKDGAWYAGAANWAVEKGYMTAAEGVFDPDGTIDRESMVVAMYIYAKDAGYDVDNTGYTMPEFSDIDEVDPEALEAWTWAVRTGIIVGTGTTPTLSPNGTTTRAEQAVITARFMALEA